MKANELRIGNWIIGVFNEEKELSEECKVACLDNTGEITDYNIWVDGNYEHYEGFYPIPLTEERLIEFGFVKRAEKFYGIRIKPSHWLEISLKTKRIIIFHKGVFVELNYKKYAHELQNLYFSLCGEELKTPSENPKL